MSEKKEFKVLYHFTGQPSAGYGQKTIEAKTTPNAQEAKTLLRLQHEITEPFRVDSVTPIGQEIA